MEVTMEKVTIESGRKITITIEDRDGGRSGERNSERERTALRLEKEMDPVDRDRGDTVTEESITRAIFDDDRERAEDAGWRD